MARLLAKKLGWAVLDTDDLIARQAGKAVSDIFATEGEAAFRELEHHVLEEACMGQNAVIATGGGVVADAANRSLMRQSGLVICLEAQLETIHQRLRDSERRNPSRHVRPLLTGEDPLQAIERLKASRQAFYAEADWTVHTDALSLQQVAEEALRGWSLVGQKRFAPDARSIAGPVRAGSGDVTADSSGLPGQEDAPAYEVKTGAQSYPGYVGWGILNTLGQRMRQVGLSKTAYIIADGAVYVFHGAKIQASLKEAGFTTDSYVVDPGEHSKSMASTAEMYTWLAERKAERGHCIVSLGGGMVSDLAGFAAATYLRGMPLVHVPTSLLAMVDASIGGKAAINLKAGKNLVGAFYQPRLVMADAETLITLPARELTAGWAEVVKHALIQDADLFAFMLENREKLVGLAPQLTVEVIKRSAAIKAHIVSEDERETTGQRMLLNYGHTIGHALEAATGYQGLLHGEAVAIGMAAAAHIAQKIGLLEAGAVDQQRMALEAFGLPSVAPVVAVDKIRQAMELDKKVSGKVIQWVLLEGIGHCTIKRDVPSHVVDEALRKVLPRWIEGDNPQTR